MNKAYCAPIVYVRTIDCLLQVILSRVRCLTLNLKIRKAKEAKTIKHLFEHYTVEIRIVTT